MALLLSEPEFADFASLLTTGDQLESFLNAARAQPQWAMSASLPFVNATAEDVIVFVDDAATQLDGWMVLSIAVASERMFFDDLDARVKARTKDAVRPKLQALKKQQKDDVRLGQILDAWGKSGATGAAMKAYGQLLKVRHWRAHGERWTLKTAFSGGAWDAWGIVEDVVMSLRKHVASDFPRR